MYITVFILNKFGFKTIKYSNMNYILNETVARSQKSKYLNDMDILVILRALRSLGDLQGIRVVAVFEVHCIKSFRRLSRY